ncbi:hypothetical protein T03_17917 [Trichinella britovi]|uniref:Uncharacterized protein n=1 Tax=Trichinella britovi TaxID=45882 RepID=A0A0V1C8X5_TRIBR|nr:hypothetical protein T03_17917 [Trichinella britovi]
MLLKEPSYSRGQQLLFHGLRSCSVLMWRTGAAISISALTCGILSQQLVPDSFRVFSFVQVNYVQFADYSIYIPAGNQLRPVLAAKSGKILPLASSIRISNVQASSVTITVVSTIGIQLIWTARLLDSQSKATVDDIKVVNKIHDRAHHDWFPFDFKCSPTIRMTAACKLFPHILASARTQRQVIAFDKSLSAINCSARPEISRCTIFLLVRETKSTASCGPVSHRI